MANKKKIEPVEPVQCCGKDECEVCPFDKTEPVTVAEVETPKLAGVHVVKDGDSWSSIAGEHAPAGVRKHEYALILISINNGVELIPGAKVKL